MLSPGATLADRAAALAAGTAVSAAGIDSGQLPSSVAYDQLRRSGLLAMLVPCSAGGDGAGFGEYTQVLESIALLDAPTALGLNMHNVAIGSICESGDQPLDGPAADFRAWIFDQVVNQHRLFASATSEAGAGAKLSKLQTQYRPAEGGWRLSGRKSFVSLAGVADYFFVAARSADGDSNTELSHFVVAADDPGVSFGDFWPGSAMTGTATATMTLDDVAIGAERLVMGVEGMSLFKLAREPHWMTSGYTGVYLGLAGAVYREVVAAVRGNQAKAADPVTIQEIGNLAAELMATRALVYSATALVDSARGSSGAAQAVHAAKYRTGELLSALALSAVKLCGTTALDRSKPLERLLREAPYCRVMPAKPGECLEYLGKAALGVNLRDTRNFQW